MNIKTLGGFSVVLYILFIHIFTALRTSRADWAFFLGLRDVTGNNEDYKWQDGDDLTFDNFGGIQPNNINHRCAVVVANPIFGGFPGVWDDLDCSSQFGVVCETDPASKISYSK